MRTSRFERRAVLREGWARVWGRRACFCCFSSTSCAAVTTVASCFFSSASRACTIDVRACSAASDALSFCTRVARL